MILERQPTLPRKKRADPQTLMKQKPTESMLSDHKPTNNMNAMQFRERHYVFEHTRQARWRIDFAHSPEKLCEFFLL